MGKTCCRCGESDPSCFYETGTAPWCKACYREWHRSRYAPSTGADDTPRKCRWCGEFYSPRQRRPSEFCSRGCKDKQRRADQRAQLEASKPERACVHCSAPMPKAMRADAKFCSQDCNDAAHAITRKMAKRASRAKRPELVERGKIAERDRFRCGICGGRVDMTRKHPDPLAPSIDHILPLALGGSNDDANLQLAHLRCNLAKQARGGNAQLRLIG